MPKSLFVLCLLVPVCAVCAEADGAADLTLRVATGLRYQWSVTSASESSGRQQGKPFTLKNESSNELVLALRARQRSGEGLPLAARVEDYARKDKAAIADQVAEIEASKTRVKATENGKVMVDSDNDVNLEEIKAHRERIKQLLDGEARFSIDPTGKLVGEIEGEPLVGETLKTCGLEGVLRILPGRTVRVGESWEDSQSLPTIGAFRLARPAVIRSKATFARWEEKDGRRLARIEIAAKWDTEILKGENGEGLLVEITRVQGASTGVCYFDPQSGVFVEGTYDTAASYRLDGSRDGQNMGLDVTARNGYRFKKLP